MNLIYSVGTKVVALRDVEDPPGRRAHPAGAVGVVVQAPLDLRSPYRVRFIDGVEAKLAHEEIERLAEFSLGDAIVAGDRTPQVDLYDRVFLKCVVGSRAFGLDGEDSDTDRRGVYLPPAARHWSLVGVPEQLENDATQEVYWELQKFLVLALKANPNVLETLYSPIMEFATPLGERLLAMRSSFLSRMIYQTYNGYVLEQLFSPLVVTTTPWHEELKAIGRRCVTRFQAHHYLGFAETQWKLFEKEQPPRAKPLLYVYRVLLTGLHLMRTGEIEANLPLLNEDARLPFVDDLAALKLAERESVAVSGIDVEFHRVEVRRLIGDLEAAMHASSLPETSDAEGALNDLLVRLRLDECRGAA